MKRKTSHLYFFSCYFSFLSLSTCLTDSQWLEFGPNIYSFYINETATGYNGLPADCDWIKYTDDFVYISASGIPNYDIGPSWGKDPGIPGDVNYIYSIPRNPESETGEKSLIMLGQSGALVNGVPVFNPSNADTYNSKGVWNYNAYYWEISTMDSCLGHPAGQEYHHHFWPKCLYPNENENTHSSIYGFAFDGFPIYGPFGYSDPTDAESSVKRIQTSYKLRNITKRTTLPDGTILSSDKYGPDVSDTYPLSSFTQDYEYDDSLGDLDEYNGRFSITPDYPNGTYAYFITIDANHDPEFPFIMGFYFYGKIYDSQHNIAYDTVPNDAIEFNKTAWLDWNTTYQESLKKEEDNEEMDNFSRLTLMQTMISSIGIILFLFTFQYKIKSRFIIKDMRFNQQKKNLNPFLNYNSKLDNSIAWCLNFFLQNQLQIIRLIQVIYKLKSNATEVQLNLCQRLFFFCGYIQQFMQKAIQQKIYSNQKQIQYC